MPGSTPSRSRPCASRPVTPMSERQQLKLVRQMETSDNRSGTPPTPGAPRRPNRCNGRGETPLHKAAIKGDADSVRKLLEDGADPNTPDFAGWTPLHEACNHGWYEVANVLVDAGADVNVRGLDDDTPLHDAAGNGHAQLIVLLVDRGADINARNQNGKTPCDIADPSVLHYLLNQNMISNLALEKRLSMNGDADSALADLRRTRVEKSPRVTLKLHQIKKRTGKLTFEDNCGNTNGHTRFSIGMDEKGNKDDIYEFKSSKEATPVRGNSISPDLDKPSADIKGEKSNERLADSEPLLSSLGKRTADNETEENEDEIRRKKKKEEGGKDTNTGGKTVTNASRLASVRTGNSSSKSPGHTPAKSSLQTARTVLGPSVSTSDRKSPSSPKGPAPSPTTATPKAEGDTEGDGEKLGPKVPPLKIVIPQDSEQGTRNGKNNSSRHTALPYVVSSNSNDSEKDGSVSPTDPAIGMLSAEDLKNNHQRVLRSSHRERDGQPARPGSTGSNAASGSPGAPPPSTGGNSAGPSSNENSPPCKQENMSGANVTREGSPAPSSTTPPATNEPSVSQPPASSSSNRGSDPPTPSSVGDDEKPADTCVSSPTPAPAPAPVDLHPRKRKLKHSRDPKEGPPAATASDSTEGTTSSGEPHPHDQPVKNCYQLFLDIRRQVERRRQGLFPVQPKPPQGFKEYLLNRCTYLLASNESSRQIPSAPMPTSIHSGLKELFTEQEKERHNLKLQHVIEREKLVLSVEQEILRVHGRAARALANQSVPFSVCTVLKDKEVYNLITPEQEEKDRNARSRYNGRLFLSWLQDVDDKWDRIKEHMHMRQRKEAETLHAVQKMNWEWKMIDLGLSECESKPVILDTHVPIVPVTDDFDLMSV